MKKTWKMWLVDGSVSEVEVSGMGTRVSDVTLDGRSFECKTDDLFDSEESARREHVDREACDLEELADRHDRQRAQAEELAKGHMDDAKWNAEKAAEARARAKGLRDALEEVKDATEGRR